MVKRIVKILKTIIIFLVCLCITVLILLFFVRNVGKEQLVVSGEEYRNNGEFSNSKDIVTYKGDSYKSNSDIFTILIMGIDEERVATIGGQSWSASGEAIAGGHADALFLAILNQHERKLQLISINRNSMVDVDVWDENGNYIGVFTKQVALQHGYGDGKEESCKRQIKTVSRMLKDIPINSYVAISMDAIPELNDAVGGIQVEVLDDIIYPEYNMNLNKGEIVTLYGEDAYWYVRLRNEGVFNSNELRLQRQKQYLKAYVDKVIEETQKDPRMPLEIYKTLEKYIVTDIDISRMTYLATEVLHYNIELDDIRSIPGETVQGNNFEEYYIDNEGLEELIIEIFYTKVKNDIKFEGDSL